jgi:hypothetical protein
MHQYLITHHFCEKYVRAAVTLLLLIYNKDILWADTCDDILLLDALFFKRQVWFQNVLPYLTS